MAKVSKVLNSIIFSHTSQKIPSLIRLGGEGREMWVVTGNSLNINHVFGAEPEQQRQQ